MGFLSWFKNVLGLTFQLNDDDVVVFVVGPSGSGKSWFTREATNSDLIKTSRKFRPSTDKVRAIRCELTEKAKENLPKDNLLKGVKNVVFVDTPSFLTGCKHPNAREAFKKWLEETKYEPRPEHVSVVYTHQLATDPVEHLQVQLEEFFEILRIGSIPRPERLLVVGTYDKESSNVSLSKIIERTDKVGAQLKELESLGWRFRKASMHEKLFLGNPEEAWGVVADLLSKYS